MKRFIRDVISMGFPFGLLMAAVEWGLGELLDEGFSGWMLALLGACNGLLFGITMAFIARSKWARRDAMPKPEPGERYLRDATAYHVQREGRSKGWLVLTDKRITFTPAYRHGRKHKVEIRLEAITDVRLISDSGSDRTDGLLQINLADGSTSQFATDGASDWKERVDDVAGVGRPL